MLESPLANVEAEKALLGGIMIGAGAEFLHVAMGIIGNTGDIFHDRRHRFVYEAMVALVNSGRGVSLLEVEAELRRVRRLGEIGGTAYLTELVAHDWASLSAISNYANQVRDMYVRRQIERVGADLVRVAYSDIQVRDIGAAVIDRVRMTLAEIGAETDAIPGERMMALIEKEVQRKDAGNSLVTGISPLDARLGPMESGLMFVLAPTSTGKTSLLMQMVRENAIRGHRPVFYFNELSPMRIARRFRLMEAVDWEGWMRGETRQPEPRLPLDEVKRRLAVWMPRVTVVPAEGWTAEQIVAHFTGLWAAGKCDQVYVDYLDLIPYKRYENMSEAIGDKLAILRHGAASCRWNSDDEGIPIVVAGQPRKGIGESRPTMDDAFGSVRIQQYSYKFITLWREREGDRYTGITLARIEKNPDVGNEGYECPLMVVGSGKERAFIFYPVEIERRELIDEPF